MTLSSKDLIQASPIESDQETLEIALEQLRGRVSDRAFTGETMLLNMGPQHPSTHGVLRLLLELDGETIVNCLPDIGYLHTGIEKSMEAQRYEQALVMTDRMDYLNNLGNNLAYCLAVEKLCELDVPPRAQYIRVIMAELQRIASHLVWLGTHVLDLGATSLLLYAFREREHILDMFEMVSGQRMMGNYIRPGGIWRDLTDDFIPALRRFLDYMPGKIDDYERLLNENPFFIDRTKGIGVIPPEVAIDWSLTGPALRGSGVNFDIRKAIPYSSYDHFEFDVPLGTNGDVYDRYRVRIEEMRQSLRIIHQALDNLPGGPFRSTNRKFVPPPRSELGHSMEAVIHHFKLWTEGFKAPKGEVYVRVESPRGELGVYLVGDGGPRPYRIHFRTPSFMNLQSLGVVAQGHMVADLVAIIGSVDIVLGDCDR
ncbi:MAG TPA: NADH dehydrogenase (quinone) subunit D [Chloroflexi bacterium]|nr:NADH dehydrogenase (quinone) subunit D [Chloroflexota bacterium]